LEGIEARVWMTSDYDQPFICSDYDISFLLS